MKILALIAALFFTVNSIAVAPYGFRGQNQTAVQYSNVLQFPNSQVTKLAGINSLVETGNKNILLNPDFENNTFNSSWTATTVTPAVETTTVISGKKSVIMTPSAQTFTFVQDSTLYASNFQGSTQLLAMVWVRTNQNGIKVCSRNDGVTSTTNCATVAPQSPSVWQLIKVPFISSSTSNGISIEASTSITGNVYIDDAFVGAVDLKTDVSGASLGSVTTPGTTSCSWSGSTVLSGTTLVSFAADADCPVATASGIATAPATKIPAITLPAGTGPILDFRLNGTFRTDKATATNAACYWELYDGTNQYPLNIPVVGGASGNQALAVTQLGTRVVLSSPLSTAKTYEVRYASNASPGSCSIPTDSATISNFQIAVTSYPSSGNQIYSASCGANCVDRFDSQVSSAGVVSAENQDFVNGNCVVTATSTYTCTFITPSPFTTAPNCSATPTGAPNITGFTVDSVSTSSVVVKGFNTTTNVALAGSFALRCSKTGADFVATRTIVGSFAEVVTSKGIPKPAIVSAEVSSAGAVSQDESDFINGNCVVTDTSLYTCTWSTSFWLAAPKCIPNITNGSQNFKAEKETIPTTSLGVFRTSNSTSGAKAASGFTLICHGSIP